MSLADRRGHPCAFLTSSEPSCQQGTPQGPIEPRRSRCSETFRSVLRCAYGADLPPRKEHFTMIRFLVSLVMQVANSRRKETFGKPQVWDDILFGNEVVR